VIRPRVSVIGIWSDTALPEAIAEVAEITPFPDGDIVHAASPRALAALAGDALLGKRVVVEAERGVVATLLTSPDALSLRRLVMSWVVHSREDADACAMLGRRYSYVPVPVDLAVFDPAGGHDVEKKALRARLDADDDAYLVALVEPNATDAGTERERAALNAIVEGLGRATRVHLAVVGTGASPLRRRLQELGLPHSVLPVDPRSLTALSALCHVVDVYLGWRASEGSALVAAVAAGCKAVGPASGLSADVLEPNARFGSAAEAIRLLLDDRSTGALGSTVRPQIARVRSAHDRALVAAALRALYTSASLQRPYARDTTGPRTSGVRMRIARAARGLHRIVRRPDGRLTVSLWHRFVPPPYGGGNQFMIALGRALEARGMRVLRNAVCGVDVHVLQGIGFDVPRFLRHFRLAPAAVVHRIDGPVHLYRGFDRDKDEAVFRLNTEVATATVVQSRWSLERTVDMGYRPIDPVLIPNAADPSIFAPRGARPLPVARKIRLISSSWSDNPRKGGAVYRFLDRHLDWSRFEYTFIGRTAERFENIRVVPPVPSEDVAAHLREHDVYVTASRNDPCSNALVEALTCGLPALYAESGGHPELVGHGGVAFHDERDVLAALERLLQDYDMYAGLVTPPTMTDVTARYAALIEAVRSAEWVGRPVLDEGVGDGDSGDTAGSAPAPVIPTAQGPLR